MKIVMMAAAVALLAGPALAQTVPGGLQVQIPELPTATADPTCGGKPALAQQAFCVSTTQAGIGALVDAYSEAFSRQGWQSGGGRENLVVYLKPKASGVCLAFQMLAFADEGREPAPAAPAYLAFAAVPGDVACGPPAAPATPAQ
jgi:hypothetical protein